MSSTSRLDGNSKKAKVENKNEDPNNGNGVVVEVVINYAAANGLVMFAPFEKAHQFNIIHAPLSLTPFCYAPPCNRSHHR